MKGWRVYLPPLGFIDFEYTSTAVNIITLKDDGSVAGAITLPGDLQRVAVP